MTFPGGSCFRQTEFTEELQALWTYIEGSVLREYSTFTSPGAAFLRKRFMKSNPYLLCDVDFFNNFVRTNGLKIGRSYFLWSVRVNFCYGLCLLLQKVHFAAYQFLNRALLTFEVLNQVKNLQSLTFEYGDLTMKVNLSYLQNLLTQVKILFSNLKESRNLTRASDVLSENEVILATLEPVFDNLSEAKKDVDTLMKNLESMKNCLNTIWKSNQDLDVESERFGKLSLVQNKLDISYLELFLGSYVSGTFNTQEITLHLDKLIEFETTTSNLSVEFKMRLVNCLLKILHVTVNRAKMRPVDENSVGTSETELERFKGTWDHFYTTREMLFEESKLTKHFTQHRSFCPELFTGIHKTVQNFLKKLTNCRIFYFLACFLVKGSKIFENKYEI